MSGSAESTRRRCAHRAQTARETPVQKRSGRRKKAAAVRARDALAELLRQHNYEMTLENIEPDKYGGRIIADALIGGVDAAQYLIQKRLAVPYDGGTKQDVDWSRLR